MADGLYYDGIFTARFQHGAPVREPLLLERCSLWHVTYRQLLTEFRKAKPSLSDRGELGKPWAQLPLIACSEAKDVGGGVCEFTITWAETPSRLFEYELFTVEYQEVNVPTNEITASSVPVRTRLTWQYYVTSNPIGIPARFAFRAIKIGNVIQIRGDDPGSGEWLCEDESPVRWKESDIWVVQSRYAPHSAFAAAP